MAHPHVLVIEDELDVRVLLEQHLRALGCRVDAAESGVKGLELAVADPPDIVIIDILLPDIDGRDIVRRLRADERTKRCHLVVSSVLDPQDLLYLATELLDKPFGRASVTRLVDSYRTSQAPED
ncbi:response regulator [Streptomyces sp. DH10]|uniref:response regulator n=1 Tax=Streptomyces sp. DH10 TaxID=3040121 RepID=UPI002440EF29|nr:response regulator [Streptomyces sp. DH10]MDG9710622.1 response regulator [Streptomyces sp. DH10]